MEKVFFEPGMESIRDIQAFVLGHLPADQDKPDKTAGIELVIEELVINTVKHGFKDKKDGMIKVCAAYSDPELKIEIRDNGVPFNPLGVRRPDTLSPLDEREPGGLGIFLVKKMTERIKYSYENHHNILKIIFRI